VIRISPVLLDEVSLKGRGDFVGRLQRVVDGPVPCGVVNHVASIPRSLRDVQIAARHAGPHTMRYDRARKKLDRTRTTSSGSFRSYSGRTSPARDRKDVGARGEHGYRTGRFRRHDGDRAPSG
jgi:hypothetical protein